MLTPLCLLPLLATLAQAPGLPQPPPRPAQPLMVALDTNGDGILDAGEIANATASLRKLDTNGDGRLTPDEYRPPRPDGLPHGLPPAARPTTGAPAPLARPRPLLDTALDEDGDEVISAEELARAPMLLLKLDRNGDGRLTPDELGLGPEADRRLQGAPRGPALPQR